MQKSIWETGIRASYAILILLVAFWAAAWYGLFESDLPKGVRYAGLTGGRPIDSKGRKLWHWELKEIEYVEITSPTRIDLEFLQKTPNLKELTISKEPGLDVNLDISCRNGKGAFHLNEEETVGLWPLEELIYLGVIGYDVSGWKLDCLFPNLEMLFVRSWPNISKELDLSESVSVSVDSLFLSNSVFGITVKVNMKQLRNMDFSRTVIADYLISLCMIEKITAYVSVFDKIFMDCANLKNDCEVFVYHSFVGHLEIIPSGHSRIKVVIIDSYVPLEDIVKLREQGIEVSVSYREGYEEYFQTAESALKLLSKHPKWPSLEGESGVEVESATGEEPSAAFGGIQAATP